MRRARPAPRGRHSAAPIEHPRLSLYNRVKPSYTSPRACRSGGVAGGGRPAAARGATEAAQGVPAAQGAPEAAQAWIMRVLSRSWSGWRPAVLVLGLTCGLLATAPALGDPPTPRTATETAAAERS